MKPNNRHTKQSEESRGKIQLLEVRFAETEKKLANAQKLLDMRKDDTT